ncbi:MAG: Ig domain-containing protein, partial [Gammaproteobacteria bacterium]
INVTPAALSSTVVGASYSVAFGATGGRTPYSFSLSTGTLPPGLTLVGGTLSGRPTAVGTFSFTIKATDADGCIGSASYTVEVTPCPTIALAPALLASSMVGANYSVTITASGGRAPYDFTLSGGTLPPGLTFDPRGVLSGQPTAAGSFNFTIRAADLDGCTGSRSYLLRIDPPTCPTITVGPSQIAASTVGAVFSETFTATGGRTPYAFVLSSGALPPGLTLTGPVLSGRPTTAGTYSFTIKASDADGCVGTMSYSLLINPAACPTIIVGPAQLTATTVGAAFSLTFTASGGRSPYGFSTSAGFIPPGLVLDSSGRLTGQPTAAGNFSFTIKATDADGCAGSKSYSLLVNPAACPTDKATLTSPPNGAQVNLPVTLTWAAVDHAIGYRVLALMPQATVPTQLGATTATSLTVTSLPQGQIQWWVLTEFDKCPTSESGRNTLTVAASQTCSTEVPVIESPANGATGVTNPVTLRWKAVKDALMYNIYASLNGGASSLIGSSTGLSLTLTVPQGTIDWLVEATFAGNCTATRGESSRFATAVIPTCPLNPGSPSVTAPVDGASVVSPVTVRWTAVQGAASY